MKRWLGCVVVALSTFASTNPASAQSSPSPSVSDLPSPAASASVEPSSEASVSPTSSPVAVPPAASPSPSPSPAAPLPIDGAYSLPGGIWNCETLGDTAATSVYKMEGARTMVERATLHLPNRPPVEIDTTFVFNQQRGRWGLSMQNGAYVASAPTWSHATWIFEGVEADGDPHRNVRLVYTSLGPDAYRSDYEALNKGMWKTFSGATCKREIP